MQWFVGVKGASGSDLLARARRLESAGWDGLGVGDHWVGEPRVHVWSGLGALAVGTERATLLPTFANNLFRHPVDTAQAVSTLHQLAPGRVECGVGAGWHAAELEAAGLALPSPRERVDRLAEAVEVIGALIRGGACSFRGRHYRVEHPGFGSSNDPPRIVAALGGERSCRVVAPLVDRVEVMYGPAVAGGDLDFARFADLSIEALARRIDVVRTAAPDVAVGVGVFVAAGEPDTVRELRAVAGDGLQARLVGDPDEVAGALQDLTALPIDRVALIPLTADTPALLEPALLSAGSA